MDRILNYITAENICWAILALFALAWVIQLAYYLFVFSRLSFHKPVKSDAAEPPVSVIICARNELKNLKANLISILEQDYKVFQVIVVNDCSWDESEKYMEELTEKYPHLKIVSIKEQERYQHGKKFALTIGIKSAQYEHLLLTDADCYPASNQWIRLMMSKYSHDTKIVIGYGAYIRQNSFINRWVRFDTAFNAMQYLSYALGKNTYMGVGRNLSYLRSLFFANKGFASHQHIMSGDDDLFVNETASASNTAVQLHPDSFTYSQPKTSFADWFRQKKRHVSASVLYRFRHKLSLGIFILSTILFYPALVVLLISKFKIVWVASAFGLRLIIQMAIFGSCLKKLKETDLIPLIPVYDIFIAFIYPLIALSNLFVKNKTWK